MASGGVSYRDKRFPHLTCAGTFLPNRCCPFDVTVNAAALGVRSGKIGQLEPVLSQSPERSCMKIAIVSSAAIALSLLAAPAAHATVIASLGNNGSAFTSIGSLGTRVGGMVYTSDEPFADIPKGGIFDSEFLASGPSSGAPATITFNSALNYLSFLWGSPDTYNLLTLTTNLGNILTYTPQGLNFAVTDGNQAFSQYVQFKASGGEYITSAKFDVTSPTDAFEVANFRAAVPEPATWALMIMGIGFAGAAMRRRQTATVRYAI